MSLVVDRIEREIQPRIADVLGSPFLQALATAALSPRQLRSFATEYYAYALAFPKCLAEVAANAPDDESRYPLIENLWEEYGAGDPAANHRTLYQKFMHGLGIGEAEYSAGACLPATANQIDRLTRLCRHEPYLVGFGALSIGTEFFTSDEYQLILKGLQQYEFLDADSLQFWAVHTELDEFHYQDMRAVLDSWPDPQECYEQVLAGAVTAIDLEVGFWAGLAEALLPGR